MVQRNTKHLAILQEIRARVLLASDDELPIFHETELAKEFGISRTPIRKILDSLAHDLLVETRTGVGTIPSLLAPSNRQRDFEVYSQIALAASRMSGNEISNEVKMRILGLARMAEVEDGRTEALFVSLAEESIDATRQVVSDPIMSRALAAARWRVIRWRVKDCRVDPDTFWTITLSNFRQTSNAILTGEPETYLRAIAGVVSDMT